MIAIIDYGAGNLHSVQNALNFLGAENVVTGDRKTILKADRVILPGVGAFGDAMRALRQSGLEETVAEAAQSGRPFLGICLGLQLLFEESEETPGVRGLGILKGRVVRIPATGLKIPHMGWNDITVSEHSRLLTGLGSDPYVYFVHSYYVQAEDFTEVSAYTQYGARLDIAVEKGNVFATQFHPEKSGTTGMNILHNFIRI